MSPELRDLRARIDPETDAYLHAHATATRTTVADVTRKVLHEWAIEQIEIASLIDRRLRAEGMK